MNHTFEITSVGLSTTLPWQMETLQASPGDISGGGIGILWMSKDINARERVEHIKKKGKKVIKWTFFLQGEKSLLVIPTIFSQRGHWCVI